jgi:hypothetical protein
MNKIHTKLYTVGSQESNEQVEEDLKVEDPSITKADFLRIVKANEVKNVHTAGNDRRTGTSSD